MDDNDTREIFGMASATFWVILAAGLAIVIITVTIAGLNPFLQNMQTQAQRHSIGYVESRNTHMQDMIVQYKKDQKDLQTMVKGDQQATAATQAHMKSIVLDVRTTANELDPSEVAPDVRTFLTEHQNDY